MPAAAMPDFPAYDAPQAPPPPAWRRLPIQFTGSGSEYFRIWVVNLVLVVLTLGLYLPFAKARRLRYFHGNTLIDGRALGFHGQGTSMLRGHLLVLAFIGSYALADRFSSLAAGLAGLALVVLWPALWQSSLRFRLANTSWRGLRLRFTGSVAGAYRCLLPALVPLGLFALLMGLRGHGGQAGARVGEWADVGVVVCLVALGLAAPLLCARIKRYQHGHDQCAGDTTTLHATGRDFYRVALLGAGVSMLGAAVLLAAGSLSHAALPDAQRQHGNQALVVGLGASVWLIDMAVVVGVQAWHTAHLHNLVWGRTASPRLRFSAHLGSRALAALTLKNLLLTLVTLGLYRPFAVVASARMRLQSVQLDALGAVDTWVAAAQDSPGDAAGDAAGDLLGVDLGL